MILTVRNITKSYGIVTVLHNISFVVNSNECIGIVGANGVGKSTLLRILIGQEEPDAGTVNYAPSVEFGYLSQTTPEFHGNTVQDLILESVGGLRQLEERMHQLETAMATADEQQLATFLEEYTAVSTRFQDRGGYELDYRIDMVMAGLGLNYLPRTQLMQTLSGGEKERVRLATLLLRSPDLLLLDEPTNHLDVSSMEWLEQYLSTYKGAVLLASHDRQFLDRTVNAILEIDEHEHTLKRYEGNYAAYMQVRLAERHRWEDAYEQQQEAIADLRKRVKYTARNVGHTYRAPRDNDKFTVYFFEQQKQSAVSRNVRAAEEQLRRIEEDPIPKPPELMKITSHFNSAAIESQMVIELSHITKYFGERQVLRDVQMTVSPRSRIVLTGANGAGKTTLLRLILGLDQPDEGNTQIAYSARIGYLAQEPELDLNKTVVETYRHEQVGYESEFIGRLLGSGLFRLEDIHKKVKQLSIGQRRKLEIALLIAHSPNVLLLDEPTNYISLDVLEAFEAAILNFPGPVITISHDRWFIERLGGEVWTLANGRLTKQQ